MAHNEWQLLNTLLSLIDDERNDIFLHIDKKVKEMPQLYKPLHAKLFFTPKRYDVRWGDVGQVLSEMHLFKTAHNHGPYQYYHPSYDLTQRCVLPLPEQPPRNA